MKTTRFIGVTAVALAMAVSGSTVASATPQTAPATAGVTDQQHADRPQDWKNTKLKVYNKTDSAIEVLGRWVNPESEISVTYFVRGPQETRVKAELSTHVADVCVVTDNPCWSESYVAVDSHFFYGNGEVNKQGLRFKAFFFGDDGPAKMWELYVCPA